MDELKIHKVIGLIAAGVVSLILSLVPLKIRKISKYVNQHKDQITSGLQFFGGGLLLGTILILVLPEIQEHLNKTNTIPLAELLLSAGFFLVYLIEELIGYCVPGLNKLTVFSEDQDENENINNQTITNTNSKYETSVTSQEQGIDTVDPSSGRFDELSLNAITPSPENQPAEDSFTSFNPKYAGSLNTSTQSMFPNYKPKVEAAKIQSSTNRSLFHIPKLPNLKKPTFKSTNTTDSKERENSKIIRVSRYEIIAIGLLSIHALIEGLIIGLGTSLVNLWQLYSALVIHHCIISFLLGVELSEGKSPKVLKYLYSFGFAISISVGIAVGIGVHTTPIELYIFIVKGIATGALLFVVIFEVIHQEKSKINVSGLLQFGAILFGFVVTVLIKILSGGKEQENMLVNESQNITDEISAPAATG